MKICDYYHNENLILESGESLQGLKIRYNTYGKLNDEKNNVVWVCHALTANADVFDWWKGLFGNHDLFNPNDYFIICANVIGSCYGSTGPLSINTLIGEVYYDSFPLLSVRDLVASHDILRKHLGITNIHVLIGASLGGMQALEWAFCLNNKLDKLIVIASNAKQSPWAIAFNESQRMAIEADSSWGTKSTKAGTKGLKIARSIALLSYRNYNTYSKSQEEENDCKLDNFKASSYQKYQGDKFIERFDAFSYWQLTKIMDSHNLGRNREGVGNALREIIANCLIIGVSSDHIFPPQEQIMMAQHIPNAEFRMIDSAYGHDGFLIEHQQLNNIIEQYLKK